MPYNIYSIPHPTRNKIPSIKSTLYYIYIRWHVSFLTLSRPISNSTNYFIMFRFVFCSLSWSILLSGWLFCYFDPTCNQKNKVLGWYFKPDGTKWKLEWLQAEVKPFKVELATLGKPHQPGVQVDNLHHVQPLHDILHHVQHFHASYNMLHPKGHVEPHHETNVHADGLLQGDLDLFFKLY